MKRITLAAALLVASCGGAEDPSGEARAAAPAAQPKRTEAAVFAGGCFWCTEADFEKVAGVVSAVSGYTGGRTENPTYEQVSAGGTGHYEVVRITYDPARVSYQALVRHYFRTVDPTDAGGQFCDRGESYRTAIFAIGEGQKSIAEAERARAAALLKQRVVTPVLPAGRFYAAEGYHQDYYKKNPIRYSYYRGRCGRDARVKKVWGGR
jgi:peptide-methionine (S)-S-oxide reductase